VKFYDLFSGIGGFRLALERLGHNCVGSCEIDVMARTVYQKNFERLPSECDVRDIHPKLLPDFELLTAGFPCQAFSVAGKGLGFNDERGNLFFEILRIVKEKRPAKLFLENVRGLLSNDRGRTFGRILYELDKMGYDVEWQLINGKYFLPQKRERVYIIGHARTVPSRQVFPIGTEENYLVEEDKGQSQKEQLVNCIDANYFKGIDNHAQRTAIVQDGKMRMLSPVECERLLGFPDNWTAPLSNTARYKLLGNTVMIPVIKTIGERLYLQ
jgi:DNA (cytosine-5)-methyltransferase 1